MRDIQRRGHAPCIVDVLTGAARACLVDRGAVIVKLQRDAGDVIARMFQQGRRDGGIHAAGHGDDDARLRAVAWQAKVDVRDSDGVRRRVEKCIGHFSCLPRGQGPQQTCRLYTSAGAE